MWVSFLSDVSRWSPALPVLPDDSWTRLRAKHKILISFSPSHHQQWSLVVAGSRRWSSLAPARCDIQLENNFNILLFGFRVFFCLLWCPGGLTAPWSTRVLHSLYRSSHHHSILTFTLVPRHSQVTSLHPLSQPPPLHPQLSCSLSISWLPPPWLPFTTRPCTNHADNWWLCTQKSPVLHHHCLSSCYNNPRHPVAVVPTAM